MVPQVALIILLLILVLPFLLGWYWGFSFFDCLALASLFFLFIMVCFAFWIGDFPEAFAWIGLVLIIILFIWAIRQLYLKYYRGAY